NYIYPSNNVQLAKQIAEVGLLVSEYAPNVEPTTYRFPMRNRIVSGLSKGILVVEAPNKSGIFSTVESASQQNRDVFIVPGDIFSFASMGTNELLKNYRNTLVTCPDDIIKSYEITYHVKQKTTPKKSFAYQPSVDEAKILKILANGDKVDFDTIVENTGLVASEVNYLLTNLELFDILTKLSGNFYQLKTEANNEINYS
ncbi:MAG: DNA-protecting protein DprA, partial [Clostridia bacterium]|nr:DNA-protecting protein DprA [Clostridia bacterium]